MYLLQMDGITADLPNTIVVILAALEAVGIFLLSVFKKRPIHFSKKDEADSQKKPTKNILEKICRRLDNIEKNVEQSNKSYGELLKTVERNTKITKSVAKKTYEAGLYNTELTDMKRLRYFKWYIGLRGNGNGVEYAKKIILKNPKVWRDILDENDDFEIIDTEYYKDVLAEIKRHIL